MSTKGVADVVFCLDASESMAPCLDAVRKHLTDFLAGLKSHTQQTWDLRVDFVAHRAGESPDGGILFQMRSLYEKDLLGVQYLDRNRQGRFFTQDLAEFSRGLQQVEVTGDETPLVALDFCLDFPWREAVSCHRVVIMLTDEPFETSAGQDFQQAQLHKLIDKIHASRVMLFIVAPDSAVFSQLAAADRSEYEVVDVMGDGLARVNFAQLLHGIGKSISVSTQQTPRGALVERGLYRQASWGRSNERVTGR